jgi:hypothetical protein
VAHFKIMSYTLFEEIKKNTKNIRWEKTVSILTTTAECEAGVLSTPALRSFFRDQSNPRQ